MKNYTDKQNAILNQLAYVDLPKGCEGKNLFEQVKKVDKSLAKKFEDNGLNHLSIVDFDNNNPPKGSGSGFCAISFEDGSGNVGMTFRGTEGLDDLKTLKNNPTDMVDNLLTSTVGVSLQSLEAQAFYNKNKATGENNYLYGHSKGGNLALEVYVLNEDTVDKVHVINAQPINDDKLLLEQKEASLAENIPQTSG